jgi:hypothetical protein
MINIWTQWGSLLIYFEMPSWVKDFDASLVEEETDAEDVKALKVRFVCISPSIHTFVDTPRLASHLLCNSNDTFL